MSPDPQPDAGPSRRPAAIRLTLAYDDTGITVIDRTPVDKPVPPDVREPPSLEAAGLSGARPLPAHAVVTELRAPDDTTTYRQVVEQAIPETREIFDPAFERGVRRSPGAPSSGVFTVIVPDDDRAETVVVLAGPESTGAARALAGPSAPSAGAVELTRFPLRAGGGDGIV